MKEEWKDVVGYEGTYQVSDMGRVKSLERETMGRWGKRRLREKILKPFKDRDGYLQVNFCKKRKAKRMMLHRVVLFAFAGPCPAGAECGHLDNNPSNNKLFNLRWMSSSCNQAFRIDHGTDSQGARSGRAKLKEKDVKIIRTLCGDGFPGKFIAKLFNVSFVHVSNIKTGRSWAIL